MQEIPKTAITQWGNQFSAAPKEAQQSIIGQPQGYAALRVGGPLHAQYHEIVGTIGKLLGKLPGEQRKRAVQTNLGDLAGVPEEIRQGLEQSTAALQHVATAAVRVQSHVHPVVEPKQDVTMLMEHAVESAGKKHGIGR